MNQTTHDPQPTLFPVKRQFEPRVSATGICGHCCTVMPQHALEFTSPGVPEIGIKPHGLRCKNAAACADRERKMMATNERVRRDWDMRGVA